MTPLPIIPACVQSDTGRSMSDTRVTIAETADVPATPSRFRPPTRTLFEGGRDHAAMYHWIDPPPHDLSDRNLSGGGGMREASAGSSRCKLQLFSKLRLLVQRLCVLGTPSRRG